VSNLTAELLIAFIMHESTKKKTARKERFRAGKNLDL